MSDITEYKDVTELKKVVTGCICDGCKKTVDAKTAKEWFHFSSHHQGWGNNSIDSHESYDACSFYCFIQIVTGALKELEPYADDGARIAHMPYEFAKRMVEEIQDTPIGNGGL